MLTFEKIVTKTWGKQGSDWLSILQSIIDALSNHWSLSEIIPVNNMRYNYVALALQNNKTHVVLKISCDAELILDEYKALKHFHGHGAISALDINTEYHALLLEQAVPGYLLKTHHPHNIKDTIHLYAQVVKAIATHPLSSDDFTHVRKWCEAIDRIQDARIDKRFVNKAKALKSILLDSAENTYLCHGDLHLENIIQHGTNWLAIDPKGIIGEMAFEAAAFDLIRKDEMQDAKTIPSKITNRVTKLSNALALDFNRLLSWIFLRVILSAQWFIEDNGDPSDMLSLATHIYPLLKTPMHNMKN